MSPTWTLGVRVDLSYRGVVAAIAKAEGEDQLLALEDSRDQMADALRRKTADEEAAQKERIAYGIDKAPSEAQEQS